MKRKLITLLGIVSTSLWSIAFATPVTFNLGTGGSGTTYDVSNPLTGDTVTSGSQSVTVYGGTVSNNPTSGPNDGGPGLFTNVVPVFSVTAGQGGNIASGMAPYISSQGGFTSQLGITETDVLVLNLSGITAGSTVQFAMTQGDVGESFNVYTGTANTTNNLPTGIGTSKSFSTGANPLANEVISGQTVATNPTFTLTASANEWIAIQADCKYLLLNTITVWTPTVPEPKFYGLLAIGLIAIAFAVRQRRLRAAAEPSSESLEG